MARTPLVDVFRRAAAIAAHARRTGEPLDSLIERDRELRIDHARRRFLGQSLGVSAALMLGGCATKPPQAGSGTDDVGIVGAGIAGLTAA